MQFTFPVEIQTSFERDILDGTLPKKKIVRLPEFINTYKTNSQDASKVLNSAFRKGLVSKEEDAYLVLGKSQPSVESVFQHADKSGLSPKSLVRAVEVIPADDLVAKRLRVEVGQPVFRQVRTRLVNDEIIANQNNYIPIEVCPTLEFVDLTRASFQVTLETTFNTVIAKIDEQFELMQASGEDSEILSLAEDANILAVRRLSLSATGMPLVWADIHVRIDRYHYVKKLWPKAAVLLEE